MSNNYLTHEVTHNTTIQLIATKYNCEWEDLVRLNSLVYPYIVDELQPNRKGVRGIGELLYIPIGKSNSAKASESLEDRVYGKDIAFEQHEDYSMSPYNMGNNSAKDINLVAGLDNLIQALYSRLTVEKGDLVLYPDYGTSIRKYIGKGGTISNLVKIKVEVIRSLSQDYRVEKIGKVIATFSEGAVTIDIEVIPIKPLEPFTLTINRRN